MPITTLPDVAEFGGTKVDRYAATETNEQLAAGDYNALTGRVVAAFAAIGLDDGSTSGSLREAALQINDQLGELTTDVGNVESIVNDLIAALGTNVQVVSDSTATITTARHVIVTYAAGNVTLTLPDASAAREVSVWKATDAQITITLARSAADVTGGCTINGVATSLQLLQGDYNESYGRWDIVGQAPLVWLADPVWYALSTLKDLHDALEATVNGILTVLENGTYGITATATGSTFTVVDEDTVVVTYTGGTCVITLPPGTYTRNVRIIKAHTSAVGIELARDGSDVINGSGSNYALPHSANANAFLGEWHAKAIFDGSPGQWAVSSWGTAIAANTSAIATNTSNISTNTTDITNLKGGFVPSANVRNLTSGTTATILAGETLVRQGSANAMALTLPAATLGAQIDIIKDTTNAGAITLIRAGSDTIHGSASNYVLDGSTYVTSATTYRRRWTITCLVAGEWTVT